MDLNNVNNALKKIKDLKIAVVGDLILDIYSWGNVERISPEAPVQVFEIESDEKRLGGAGNVINNLIQLNAKVSAVSIIGKNEHGNAILEMLKKNKVDCSGIFFEGENRYSVKNRIVSTDYNHQIIRIDRETKQAINKDSEEKIINYFSKKSSDFDIIIISDYLKGLLTESLLSNIISIANKNNVPVIIDPKGKNFSKYKNATIITPNKKEAETASGIIIESKKDMETAGRTLLKELNLKALLITLGKDGMAFLDNKDFYIISAKAREVYDVSGAGDTVISVFAAGIGAGIDWLDAVNLSNTAAGIVVGKLGTEPITMAELLDEIDKKRDQNKKIIELDKLSEISKKLKDKGKKIVFTNGCFDLLHVGHTDYLNKAKMLGDVLIIGLNSDKSVSKLKGPNRPIISQEQRAAILSALSFVDYITIFDDDTPLKLINTLKPDFLVKGRDYKKEEVVGWDIVETYGGKVELIELMEGISTTIILDKISKKNN